MPMMGRAPVGKFIVRVLLLMSVLAVFTLVIIKSYLYTYHGGINDLPYENRQVGQPVYQKVRPPAENSKQERRTLDVTIVDEHHEVLPYWFRHANNEYEGGTKKTQGGYTVFHIDGHSDFGLMGYYDGLPAFRWPKKEEDILRLMQRNDVFIMAGIGTGVIGRFIWVWPEWVRNDTVPDFGDHTSAILNLGIFNFKDNSTVQTRQGMCMCAIDMVTDGKKRNAAEVITKYAEDDGYEGDKNSNCLFATPEYNFYTKPDAKCKFVKEGVPFDIASQTFMEKHGSEILPPDTKESVILDIDEDFFGCTKGSDPLTATGLNWTHIEVINSVLNELFCVSAVREEQKLAVSLITLLKSDCASPLSTSCVSTTSSDKANIHSSQCEGREDIADVLSKLKGYITDNFSNRQFDQLMASGFCLETSPKTASVSIFKEHNPIVVCVGVNGPDSENSVFFTPDIQRVNHDLESVRKIVSQIATKNIGLVTIARSNRDGYVPRKFQPKIENGLIKILNDEVNSKVCETYDENLFIFKTR